MVTEIIRALIMGALPVMTFTFLVLQWSVAAGKLASFSNREDLDKQYEEQKKAREEEKKKKHMKAQASDSQKEENTSASPKMPRFEKKARDDFFHNKAMFFGGGFYGTMALFTYVIIEIEEIVQFLGVVFTPDAWFANLSIGLIVDFFINSIINIISAFIWFNTLTDYVSIHHSGWIWLGAAYVGYLAGVRLVAEAGDEIWAWLNTKRAEVTDKVRSLINGGTEAP